MSIPRSAIALILIISSTLYADEGWQKVKWGMTATEVAAAYPQAEKVAKPGSYSQKGVKYSSPLRLQNYELVGRKFFADFLFDSKSLLAGTVIGTPSVGGLEKGSLDIEYRNLKDLLTQKYGKPTSVEPKQDGAEASVWLSGKTEIRLNYIVSKILGESGIRLLYLKSQEEALDKL